MPPLTSSQSSRYGADLHEPGRYLVGMPDAEPGPQRKVPTVVLPIAAVVSAVPVEVAGVSWIVVVAASLRSGAPDKVTVMSPVAPV